MWAEGEKGLVETCDIRMHWRGFGGGNEVTIVGRDVGEGQRAEQL